MNTVAPFASRTDATPSTVVGAAAPETAGLAVTATYMLSEDGRKASLIAGGDGREVQRIPVQIPRNRLHLVTVDAAGHARLRLRPRFTLDGEQRVVRLDVAPTYDSPPAVEQLLRDAARNHELERAYHAARAAERVARRDAGREQRHKLAEAFLADPTQRAIVHPAPSPKRCLVLGEHGRVLFDVASDDGLAAQLPPEAHRRFRADLRARAEHNRRQRTAQLAVHEEKKNFVAGWLTQYGTDEQKARQDAGLLPMAEAIESMTDQAFASIIHCPVYTRDGAQRLQSRLRGVPQHADVLVAQNDLAVTSTNAMKATAAQWALLQDIRNKLPDANVTLRVHRLTWKHDAKAPAEIMFGVLVTMRCGPLTLRREYQAPDALSH